MVIYSAPAPYGPRETRLDPAETFRALGDPTRCRIVELLGRGPRSVSELVAEFSMSQPAVSKHLRVLRESGLVEAHSAGRRRIYVLRPEPIDALDAWVETMSRGWSHRVARLKAYLETEGEER